MKNNSKRDIEKDNLSAIVVIVLICIALGAAAVQFVGLSKSATPSISTATTRG